MAQTSIEWTDVTWNPVAGCSIESDGCKFCYAMRMAARLEAMGVEKYRGLTRKSGGRSKWTGKISLDEKALAAPLKWRKPRRVFVNSMSDLFHPSVPAVFVAAVWSTMARTPHHTYQILTKRPAQMADMLRSSNLPVLPNVWLGTSVEDRRVASRLDDLRRAPAVIRFVSFEPLIGSVQGVNLDKLDWAIVGGESGPHARPMNVAWVDEIEAMCRATGTAFFFKQWGGKNKKASGRLLNGELFDEMPAGYQL